MRTPYLTMALCAFSALEAAAQTAVPSCIEYFYDTDPGYGKGLQVSAVTEGENLLTLSTSQLTHGIHLMGIRALDTNGRWSTVIHQLVLVTTPVGDIASAEYFYDTDPGYGNGHSVSLTQGSNVLTLDTKSLAAGIHTLCLRVLDATGHWSTVSSNMLYVVAPSAAGTITQAEYYIDSDPGIGQGTSIALASDGTMTFDVATGELEVGEHTLYVRISTGTQWLTATSQPFSVTMIDGVASVTVDMTVGMKFNSNTLMLERQHSDSDMLVTVATTGAVVCAKKTWPSGNNTLSLPVTNDRILIVRCTDKSTGKTLTRTMLR